MLHLDKMMDPVAKAGDFTRDETDAFSINSRAVLAIKSQMPRWETSRATAAAGPCPHASGRRRARGGGATEHGARLGCGLEERLCQRWALLWARPPACARAHVLAPAHLCSRPSHGTRLSLTQTRRISCYCVLRRARRGRASARILPSSAARGRPTRRGTPWLPVEGRPHDRRYACTRRSGTSGGAARPRPAL